MLNFVLHNKDDSHKADIIFFFKNGSGFNLL